MRRLLLCGFLALLWSAPAARAETPSAPQRCVIGAVVVAILHSTYLGTPEPEDPNDLAWFSWIRWNVVVKAVVAGENPGRCLDVHVLQHADYNRRARRNVLMILTRGDDGKTYVPYATPVKARGRGFVTQDGASVAAHAADILRTSGARFCSAG